VISESCSCIERTVMALGSETFEQTTANLWQRSQKSTILLYLHYTYQRTILFVDICDMLEFWLEVADLLQLHSSCSSWLSLIILIIQRYWKLYTSSDMKHIQSQLVMHNWHWGKFKPLFIITVFNKRWLIVKGGESTHSNSINIVYAFVDCLFAYTFLMYV